MFDNNGYSLADIAAATGKLLKKVLCHEITHAAMFSYNVQLTLEQEQLIADLISTYGEEIVYITNKIFTKLENIN